MLTPHSHTPTKIPNHTPQRIRAAENALGVTSNNQLHIQMMNNLWGSGDPTQYLTNNWFAAYDDHRYLKWSDIGTSQSSYISTSCNDNRGGNSPTIVGEFSLSVPDSVQWTSDWNPNTQQAFYKKWFAAQAIAYEKQSGWVFWTWKSQLGDYRWSYKGTRTSLSLLPFFHMIYTLLSFALYYHLFIFSLSSFYSRLRIDICLLRTRCRGSWCHPDGPELRI
jgi:hypothetical protein